MGRAEEPADLVLGGATVYARPGAPPLHDALVVLRGGRIAAIAPRSEMEMPRAGTVLDCGGCFIAAGFCNAHVHFHERMWADAAGIPAVELRAQLQAITRFGFTRVFDLSSRRENTQRLRDRIESGEVCGPQIRTTGEGLIPTGGTPSADVFRVMGLMETKLKEVSTAGEARRAAQELLADGVDGLKLFISSPPASAIAVDAIRAAVDEAHHAAKPVFAHPNAADDISAALDGGVDVIAHTTPRSGVWDDAILVKMQSSGAGLIPTLMVWQSMLRHDRASVRQRTVETALDQLRAWLACHGEVLFGTDLGAVEYDPTEEYRLMGEAGATFEQILASLTTAPARRFEGDARRAEVRVGNPADLVVLDADPAQDCEAFAAVRYTLRAGEIIFSATKTA